SAAKGADLSPNPTKHITAETLPHYLTPHDLKRLESYAANMLDHHVIMDLIPTLATLFFTNRTGNSTSTDEFADNGEDVKGINLNPVQKLILLGIGLQRKDVSQLEKEMSLPSSQVLAMFVKVIRKFSAYFRSIKALE